MQSIYFHKKLKRNFLYSEEQVNCFACEKEIEYGRPLVIQRSFSLKRHEKKFYCPGCLKDHQKLLYDEFLTAVLVEVIPTGCSLFVEDKPSLTQCRNTNLAMAAYSDKDIGSDTSSIHIIDKTKISRDPNQSIMLEAEKTKHDFEKLEAHLDGRVPMDSFFDDVKNSKIEYKGTKKLEIKNETNNNN